MPNAILSWSGGKDSLLALERLRREGKYDVAALLSTYNSDFGRVFMHGVRIELLRMQAESLGLPLTEVGLGKDHTNTDYEGAMGAILEGKKGEGISAVAFGDIFLEDLRAYRTDRLARAGMEAVFPLWKEDTAALARDFIARGYKAIVTCVDGCELDEDLAGREYDGEFLKSLPSDADPCGENGEFHTFAYDGPGFGKPVRFERGEITSKDGRFFFCDLIPKTG
ncbi:MAG: ATP-binding protein [Candidatus Altiarchaeota archaeon]